MSFLNDLGVEIVGGLYFQYRARQLIKGDPYEARRHIDDVAVDDAGRRSVRRLADELDFIAKHTEDREKARKAAELHSYCQRHI